MDFQLFLLTVSSHQVFYPFIAFSPDQDGVAQGSQFLSCQNIVIVVERPALCNSVPIRRDVLAIFEFNPLRFRFLH
jgi:hypothetical protein